jgi:hypothetical protein
VLYACHSKLLGKLRLGRSLFQLSLDRKESSLHAVSTEKKKKKKKLRGVHACHPSYSRRIGGAGLGWKHGSSGKNVSCPGWLQTKVL